MNYKMVVKTVGQLLRAEAILLLLPLAVSLYYEEKLLYVYGIVIAVLLIIGSLMTLPKPETRRIYAREGFLIVSLSWVLLSFFGALPFVFSGAIPSFIDAFFETVSGFTTTGATILSDIEALPKSLLFWRSFTNWIGGMGIIVFVLALLPQKDMQSMHILRAEVPGPTVGKIVSKTAATARILYVIYGVLTVAEIISLVLCDIPLFDSVTTAFATAGTGGFSVRNGNIAAYGSLSAEIVIAVFMMLFGINFNLFFLMIMKQFKRIFKSEELWVYIGIIVLSTIIITGNIYPLVESLGTALRQAGFHVIAISTTTGFVTADYTSWPTLSQIITMMLMFIGACSGSTGCGIKVGRIIILAKAGIRELRRAVNPRSVRCVKLDGAVVEKETITTTCIFFLIYMLIIGVSAFILSFDKFSLNTVLTAAITCVNNLGLGFNAVGIADNFSDMSILSKLVLCMDMLIGRLEIFPMIILFLPSTWKKSA